MEVTSLDLCKELYELSIWSVPVNDDPYNDLRIEWRVWPIGKIELVSAANRKVVIGTKFVCPAYSAGYLLRRLPRYDAEGWNLTLECQGEEAVVAYYRHTDDRHKHEKLADTPEDALCKLAIALFKANILRREQ